MANVPITVGAGIIGILLVVGLLSGLYFDRMVSEDVTVTVEKNYIKRYNNADQFMVDAAYADGTGETFKNVDSWWWGKWNSADFQRDIKENKTYRFTVTGYRVPYLSWFRNIVRFEPV